ncbi:MULTISPECIES: hypothetical protein [Methylorubrum]|uniref:hypothetical protein n=1 Tax=Methylorubrum TaxID=2282523 RepID=UPI0020A1FE07|nr:hypothetical protein [Methylorubrum zatmanii]MCP1551952.1 hypothetical protein [Methylorubrum extorquens]MCP1577072.1 hypothetical protein [Methylorubrum extorquens]
MSHPHPILRSRFGSRGLILLAIFAAATGGAWAQDREASARNECRRTPSLSEGPALGFGRITAAGRTAFVKDGLAQQGCPDAGPECRERAFLVTGDPVILGERRDGYFCASYRGVKGDLARTGWIPADAVAAEPPAPVALENWLGTWTQAEGRIAVKRGDKPGTLSIAGDATWGMGSPEQIKRGSVHLGEMSGTVAPRGDGASFAMGEKETLPVEKGGAYDCKVWLRRLGPWLVVEDNLACGGLNVSFRGVYRREP